MQYPLGIRVHDPVSDKQCYITCPSHPLSYIITLIIFGEKYILWKSLICLFQPDTFSFFDPNIVLSTLFSFTRSVYSMTSYRQVCPATGEKPRRSCKFLVKFDTSICWRPFICDSPRCSLWIPKANMFLYTNGMTENQNPICFVRGSFFTSIIKNTYCCGKLTLWPSNPTTTIQNPLIWNMFYLWHTKSNNWAIQSDLNLKTLSVWVFWQWTTYDSKFTPISRQWYRTFLSVQ